MDDHNNAVGIAIGKGARNWDDVIQRAQEVMDRSPRDGSGAGGQARWLDRKRWKKDPVDAQGRPAKLNWPKTDWQNGQVPEPYRYEYDGQGGKPRHGFKPKPGTPEITPDHASRKSRPDSQEESVSAGLLAAAARKKAALERAEAGRPGERFEDAPEALAEAARERQGPPAAGSLAASGEGRQRAPEVAAFVAEMTKEAPGDGVADILAKGPSKVTHDEVRRVMAERHRLAAQGDPGAERLFRFEQAFFDRTFGTGPAEFDETGRMIEPEPVRQVPEKPADVTTLDGEPMSVGLGRVAEQVARTADRTGLPDAVRALQSGLNLLGDVAREDPAAVAPRDLPADAEGLREAAPARLREDGAFGARTRAGTRSALAGFGMGRVDDALALGRFRNFAADSRQGRAQEDLATVTQETFGPLFRGPNAPPAKVRHEAVALQETVNDLGARTAERPGGFEPLKLDGDVGPKTAEAFRRVARETDPETLTRRLAGNLGLIA